MITVHEADASTVDGVGVETAAYLASSENLKETILDWIDTHHPTAYVRIRKADRFDARRPM